MGTAIRDEVGIRAGRMLYPIFLGQLFGVATSALTLIVVARILQPYDYGVYTFVISFYSLLNAFLAFGAGGYLSYALPRHLYAKDYNGMLRSISGSYVVACLISAALTIFGLLISGFMSGTFTKIGATPLMMELASLTVFVSVVSSMAQNVMIGFSKGGLASLIGALIAFLQLFFSVVLTIDFGVTGAVSALLASSAMTIAIGAYFIHREIARYCRPRIILPSLKELKKMLLFMYPMGISNFLNNGMTYFSVIFIGLFVTPVVLGNYGAASRAIGMISLIYGTFGLGLLPIFKAVKELKPKNEVNATYRKILTLELIIVLPMVAFAAAMAVPFVYLFVGNAYSVAPMYLTLLAIGFAIGVFGSYVNYLLIDGKNTFGILKVNLISAVAQLLLMILIVPYTKVIGMIVAIFFAGNIIEAYLYAREVKSTFGFRFNFGKILRICASALVLGVVLLCIYAVLNAAVDIPAANVKYAIELLAGAAASLLIYPAILVKAGALSGNDIRNLRTASNSLGRASRLFKGFFDYSERVYAAMAPR